MGPERKKLAQIIEDQVDMEYRMHKANNTAPYRAITDGHVGKMQFKEFLAFFSIYGIVNEVLAENKNVDLLSIDDERVLDRTVSVLHNLFGGHKAGMYESLKISIDVIKPYISEYVTNERQHIKS